MRNLALLALGLGIVFFFLNRQNKTSPQAPESTASKKMAARNSQEPTLKTTDAGEVARPTASTSDPGVRASGMSRQSGFRNLPLRKINGHWELPLKFTATLKHCEMGDLDLIRIDQKRRGIQSLILTLDDISSRRNIVYQKIDPSKLVGAPMSLKWKASDEPRPLGLYICSDVNERKTCLSARVDDINQALGRSDPRPETDKVYYFQFIQEGPQLALLDASRAQAKNPKALHAALSAEGVPAEEARTIGQSVSKTHVEIGSMAARLEGGQLVIDLPQNDPACPLPQLKF